MAKNVIQIGRVGPLSCRLGEVAISKRISLREIGRATGIKFYHLSEIHAGQRVPTLDEVQAICKYLACTAADLYPVEAIRETILTQVAAA